MDGLNLCFLSKAIVLWCFPAAAPAAPAKTLEEEAPATATLKEEEAPAAAAAAATLQRGSSEQQQEHITKLNLC